MPRGKKTEPVRDKSAFLPSRPMSLKVLGDYLDLSPATISLVLNNAPGVKSIPQETRERVLAAAKKWDKRVNSVQVTDLKEHTMEIRCLMSAANSGDAFNLRCVVREKMIAFIRENYPEAFPRMRFTATPLEDGGEGKEKARQLPMGMG